MLKAWFFPSLPFAPTICYGEQKKRTRSNGGRRMESLMVLVHSPLVGPFTWSLVARQLQAGGFDVLVPTLTDCGVLPLLVVDNSAFPPKRLIIPFGPDYPSSYIVLHALHFKWRGFYGLSCVRLLAFALPPALPGMAWSPLFAPS
jgi:hypothetical protein